MTRIIACPALIPKTLPFSSTVAIRGDNDVHFTPTVTRSTRLLSNFANDIIDLAKDALIALEKAIAVAAEALKQEISNATKFIEEKIKDIGNSIEDMVKKTIDNIKDVYNKIQEEANRIIEQGEAFVKDGVDSIQKSFLKITSIIAESVLPDFLEQSLKNNLKFVTDFVAAWNKVMNLDRFDLC